MPYLVDHSAYDAYAILIESGQKRIFYSGDLRAHGRKAALFERLIAYPPTNIDAMLLEGSSLGRLNDDQRFPSEVEIEEKLVQVFSDTEGLAMVHTSAQNIDRIVSVMRASRRTGRKLVIDLYTAASLEATGNHKVPQSGWRDVTLFVPQAQRIQIKQNAWFDRLNRHIANRIYVEHLQKAANRLTLLFRPLHRSDLEKGDCLEGAAYIYPQWEGYWESDSLERVKSWLDRNGIKQCSIHTSGHASPADLKRIVAAVHPRKAVPIHSFFPERYAELFSNVEIHNDRDWWEL
jgi:ribonuclease J